MNMILDSLLVLDELKVLWQKGMKFATENVIRICDYQLPVRCFQM